MFPDDNAELWECDTCYYKESNYERMQRTFINTKFNLLKTNEKSNEFIICNKPLFVNVFHGFEAFNAFSKIQYYADKMLIEAKQDLEDSFQLCKIGKYKVAVSLLRSVVEQVIRFLHNDMHYKKNPHNRGPGPTRYGKQLSSEDFVTRIGRPRMRELIPELKNYDNFKKYFEKHNIDLFNELYNGSDGLYDRLSKYVHTSTIDKFSSSMLEDGLMDPINYDDYNSEFSKKHMKLWFAYADEILKLLIPIMTLYQTSVLITICASYQSRVYYEQPGPEKPKLLNKDYTKSIKHYLKLKNKVIYKNLQKICDEDPCNIELIENYGGDKCRECDDEKKEMINRREIVREIEKTGKHPKYAVYKI